MSKLEYASSFRDLIVYRKARELSLAIFILTERLPRKEDYSLTDQIRRSSRSIGANIAEAWAKRQYEKHFLNKLSDADAEQQETQHWIETAVDCKYISQEEASSLLEKCSEIGRLLGGMMAKSELSANHLHTNSLKNKPNTLQTPTDDCMLSTEYCSLNTAY